MLIQVHDMNEDYKIAAYILFLRSINAMQLQLFRCTPTCYSSQLTVFVKTLKDGGQYLHLQSALQSRALPPPRRPAGQVMIGDRLIIAVTPFTPTAH